MTLEMDRLTRRTFLRGGLAAGAALTAPASWLSCTSRSDIPDVLFISVDDLNDWVSPLGGYAGPVHTPALERLAERGVVFTNAHCSVPACNASRSTALTGLSPETLGLTGIHRTHLRKLEPDVTTLPQAFMRAGYRSVGLGKVFHSPDPVSWHEEFHHWDDPVPEGRPLSGLPFRDPKRPYFDWGPIDVSDDAMGDTLMVRAAQRELRAERKAPLFLGVGLVKPHLPWYLPAAYFDLYRLDEVVLPEVRLDDLLDVPPGWKRVPKQGDHQRVTRAGLWKQAVQGYLAAVSFADRRIGELLDTLEESGRADRTVVVLWSDHGWHLGEKLHWRKFTLWEEATRVPLLIAGPGVSRPGSRCDEAVSLLDLFPTLLELHGAPPLPQLEGSSLVPFLQDPSLEQDRAAFTTWVDGNRSVRTRRWRYTRYTTGGEELYDHATDPHEWTNLAGDPAHQATKAKLAARLDAGAA